MRIEVLVPTSKSAPLILSPAPHSLCVLLTTQSLLEVSASQVPSNLCISCSLLMYCFYLLSLNSAPSAPYIFILNNFFPAIIQSKITLDQHYFGLNIVWIKTFFGPKTFLEKDFVGP